MVPTIAALITSARDLGKIVVRSIESRNWTTLRRMLQFGMICSMVLHLLGIFVHLDILLSGNYSDEDKIPSSPLTLLLEYLSQHMFRSIAILCLNVGLSIISEMGGPNVTAGQAVVYVYVVLRTALAILFHLGINTNLPVKVVCVEIFLVAEGVVACVVFIVLSVKFVRIRRRLQDLSIGERSLVEPMLDAAKRSSIIFAGSFLMDALLRIWEIAVPSNPLSQLITATREREGINMLRVTNHGLFRDAITGFLFVDMPPTGLNYQRE